MSEKRYRTAIIESSPVIQEGLKSILEENDQFEVVGQLFEMARYEERLVGLRCDLILINPSVVEFSRRGSIASLFKSFDKARLVALIYGATDLDTLSQYDGVIDLYCDPGKIRRIMTEAAKTKKNETSSGNNDSEDLSLREQEVLIEVVKGLTSKEIAEKLNLSVHTVLSHRKNITRKTGIKSTSGLTVYAILNGIIDQNEVND